MTRAYLRICQWLSKAVGKRNGQAPLSLLLTCTLALATPALAAGETTIGGVKIEETLTKGNTTLVLQGAGLRKRLFLKLYAAGPYVPEGSPTQPSWLVDSDEPIAITLDIVSDLVTRDKMVEALNDGFSASTGGNTSPVSSEIAALESAMGGAMAAGSSMSFFYEPAVGTHVSRDGESVAIIEGLAFKRALFGIWLSDKPVATKLKAALLGN